MLSFFYLKGKWSVNDIVVHKINHLISLFVKKTHLNYTLV